MLVNAVCPQVMKGAVVRAGEGEDEAPAPRDCSVVSLGGTMARPLVRSSSLIDAQSAGENSHQGFHFCLIADRHSKTRGQGSVGGLGWNKSKTVLIPSSRSLQHMKLCFGKV